MAVAVLVAVGMVAAALFVVRTLTGQSTAVTGGVSEEQALAGDGDWTHFADPTGTFTVEMPAEPAPVDSGDPPPDMVRVVGHQVAYANSFFEVTYAEFDPEFAVGMNAQRLLYEAPQREADNEGGRLRGSTADEVSGQPAIHYTLELDDGSVLTATAVIWSSRLYYIEVLTDEPEPDGFDRMARTFTFK
jgi:hypothetical protein